MDGGVKMLMSEDGKKLEYSIQARWDGNVGAFITVRKFNLRTDTNTDGGDEGPLPAEMLLSALSGCLMINWGRLIRKMHLKVESLNIVVSGWRNLHEPQLQEINYVVRVKTSEPRERIEKVKALAEKYGTVFNTIGKEKIKGRVEMI